MDFTLGKLINLICVDFIGVQFSIKTGSRFLTVKYVICGGGRGQKFETNLTGASFIGVFMRDF